MALIEGLSSSEETSIDDTLRREGEEEGGEAVVGGETDKEMKASSEGGWLGSDACIAVRICAREAMLAACIIARKKGARNSKI